MGSIFKYEYSFKTCFGSVCSILNCKRKLSLCFSKIFIASSNFLKSTFSFMIKVPQIFPTEVPCMYCSVYQIAFCGLVKSYNCSFKVLTLVLFFFFIQDYYIHKLQKVKVICFFVTKKTKKCHYYVIHLL